MNTFHISRSNSIREADGYIFSAMFQNQISLKLINHISSPHYQYFYSRGLTESYITKSVLYMLHVFFKKVQTIYFINYREIAFWGKITEI